MIKLKILQVNCVYKRGSTGKIVFDIHQGLKENGIESIVCYGRGHKINEPGVYKTSYEILAKYNALRSRITGLQYNGCFIATHKLIRVIKREKPDIVHLHCINGYFVNIYRLFKFLKQNKIKTVLTLHAEFMYTGSCGHAFECNKWLTGCGKCPNLWYATRSYFFDRTHTAWKKMKEAFDGFENMIIASVSKWVEDRAKLSPIMQGHQFRVIGNGIDTKNVFYPRDFQHLLEKHKITNEKIILHVTASFNLREDNIKGSHYIVKLAERLKGENMKIIVIGSRDISLKLPENIINVGQVHDQHELAAYYSMADLTLITSKRETFSMICAESLACGTPVVGFKAGAPEMISLSEYSEFVEYGNIDKLKEVIKKWINKKPFLEQSITRTAKNIYSKEKMYNNYISVYKELQVDEGENIW